MSFGSIGIVVSEAYSYVDEAVGAGGEIGDGTVVAGEVAEGVWVED